jgi:probable rRNA maturation factor
MTAVVSNASTQAVDEVSLGRLADFVMDTMGVAPGRELSLQLVDVDEMTRLHVDYMGEPGPTDVLAFPMDDDDEDSGVDGMPELLGDVVLCPEVAAEQAVAAGHDTEAELHLLCTHGILHLLGYDHHDPEEEREMFGLQARLLGDWANVRTKQS